MTIKELYDSCTNPIEAMYLNCNEVLKCHTQDEISPPLANLAFLHAFGDMEVKTFSIYEYPEGYVLAINIGSVSIAREQVMYRNHLNMIMSEIEIQVDKAIENY